MNELEARLARPWPEEAAFSGRPLVGRAYPLAIPLTRRVRHRGFRPALGLLVISAIVLALALGVASRPLPRPAVGGSDRAALAMQVAPEGVVQVPDGFVAARLEGSVLALLLAQPAANGQFTVRQLAAQDASVARPGESWLVANIVQCSADWGLAWTRFAFAAANEPVITTPKSPVVLGMDASSSVIANSRAFVVAFPPTSPDAQFVVQYPGTDGPLELFRGRFPTGNACGTSLSR